MVRQEDRRAATTAAILAAARRTFGHSGFAATTIDGIASKAGVAKGAVYHHFASKEELFERVFDAMLAEIAASTPAATRGANGVVDVIARGTLAYLAAVGRPDARQIVLIDGPAVLGWGKWRELDQRHFGALLRYPLVHALRERMPMRAIESVADLIVGAVTEAALVCATADEPQKKARELVAGLRLMLAGLVNEDAAVSGSEAPQT